MISPIKSKLQWVRMSPVLRKYFLYIYANNKGTDQTARMRVLTRIFAARCFENLFKGSVCLIQTLEGLLRLSRLLESN